MKKICKNPSKSSCINITTIPEEVLIEIFSYLPTSDILSLSLVCKSFSSIIDNSKISKILTIYFPNPEDKECFDITRNYTRVQITTNGDPRTTFPTSTFNEHVKFLTIKNVSISGDILSKMLDLCVNLKVLMFDSVHYNGDFHCLAIYGNADPKLKNLKLELIDTDFRILKALKSCKVKSLLLKNYRDHHDDLNVNPLVTFLSKQDELKEIKFMTSCQNFFIHNKLSDVELKLEKLTFNCVFVPKDGSFEKFVSRFHESLTSFEIEDTSVLNIGELLTKFRNLRELKVSINDKILRKFPVLDKVEQLSMKRRRMPRRWFDKYPNLKRLKLGDTEANYIEIYVK